MPKFEMSASGVFPHGDNFKKWLAPFIGQPVAAVEVGSWEGVSALWLMDNILTNPESVLHCVDSWEGEECQKINGLDCARAERNFRENTAPYRAGCRATCQIAIWKGRSESMLPDLQRGISFAYIDGSHISADVLMDIMLVWRLLHPGGVLILDDYLWPAPQLTELHRPKLAIDAFLNIYQERLTILDRGYQVAVRKMA